ncbi:unnamed protein product [Adineta steineri]|uniref:Alpha/beta hydrolase fold-3 domain-containing protein n=1 Tax=Adineta steineri TaxID=433720 RepID=A0A813S311_9BILA|nr:unnamed protein product [Adineta steineri]CAF3736627.1 unnamed protein product [Adineta steineri]
MSNAAVGYGYLTLPSDSWHFLGEFRTEMASFLTDFAGSSWNPASGTIVRAITIPLRYNSTDPNYLCVRLIHSILSLKHSLVSDPARPTLSANFRAFENMLQMIPFPKNDPSVGPLTVIKEMRNAFGRFFVTPKPYQCQIKKEIFEHDGHAVDTHWINYPPKNIEKHSNKILFYIHGGEYLLGNIHHFSGIECHLSEIFTLTVLHLEYRLCPEHPLPASIDDAVAVYRALLRQNISSSQLIVMGDSAGGGLALLAVQAIITRQLHVPRGVIVLPPLADLSISGESYIHNRHTDLSPLADKNLVIPQLLGSNHDYKYLLKIPV